MLVFSGCLLYLFEECLENVWVIVRKFGGKLCGIVVDVLGIVWNILMMFLKWENDWEMFGICLGNV